MKHFNRGLAGLLISLGLLAAGCGSDDAGDTATPPDVTETTSAPEAEPDEQPAEVTLPNGASLNTVTFDDVQVHAYLGITGLNGTYIVESDNSLVIIDTQFQDPDPATFRAIADSLGKPIDTVMITHTHPDHIGGLNSAFADVNVASTATVAASIDAGDRTVEIVDGAFSIDGVDYVATEYLDAEAQSQMVLELTGRQALFTGDLVYTDTHLVLSPLLEEWIAILRELQARDAVTIFPGHGPIADASVFDDNIAYIETAIDILETATTVEEYNAELFAAYPGLPGEFFTGIYAERLLEARGNG